MKNKKIKILTGVSATLIILIGITAIIYLNLPKKSTFETYMIEKRTDMINETKVATSQANGWIRVQGTNIDYPVIYETPDAYQSGDDYTWIADRVIGEENRQAIYGHNIQNVSSNPIIGNPKHVRFEQLMAFVYEDFAKNNLYIQYSKDGEDSLYKIYAVSFVDSEESGQITRDKTETKNYISKSIESSLYKYDVDINDTDELISVITCTRYFGIESRTQFRVDARKVRTNEQTEKYSVQTTKNYDIIK